MRVSTYWRFVYRLLPQKRLFWNRQSLREEDRLRTRTGVVHPDAHLCTKLQVPSMGSTIHVGLGVSTHLAPAAADSSAMNLWWAGAQPEKTRQELKTKRFELLLVPSKPKQTQQRSHYGFSGSKRGSVCKRPSAFRSVCWPTYSAGLENLKLTRQRRSFGKASGHVSGPGGQRRERRTLGNRPYNAKLNSALTLVWRREG